MKTIIKAINIMAVLLLLTVTPLIAQKGGGNGKGNPGKSSQGKAPKAQQPQKGGHDGKAVHTGKPNNMPEKGGQHGNTTQPYKGGKPGKDAMPNKGGKPEKFNTSNGMGNSAGGGKPTHIPKGMPGNKAPYKVVNRNAHMYYAGKPRFGGVVTVLPGGYTPIRYVNNTYYYSSGIYYTKHNKGYRVVRPNRGVVVNVLPMGYIPVVVATRPYYYYYGTYYAKSSKTYVVVDPPVGAVVNSLPAGYVIGKYQGYEYYNLDGVYYTQVDYPSYPGGVGYMVVSN
jgi:hypothetical protein